MIMLRHPLHQDVNMTAAPILDAVENYRGTIVDLDAGQVITPPRLVAAWHGLARRMAECGLSPGDRVIVAVGNGPLFIAAWAAILAQEGSPLLVHMDTPPAELKRIADRFHARFLVSDAQQEHDFETAGIQASTFAGADWAEVVWGDTGIAAEASEYLYLPGVPLHPTSGTTGEQKMAIRPVNTGIAEVETYASTLGVNADDTLLALSPMSHAYSHGWCVYTPLITGASLVTMRRFRPQAVFEACRDHRISVLPAVASLLDTLMFGAGKRLYAPERRVITGGAPLTERTARNFERFSGSRVCPLYGTTETGAIAVARRDGPMAIGGYVGPAFDGVEIDVRPPTEPAELSEGIGSVHVRSRSLMAGYLIDEKLDTSCLADGWFNTGDLGRMVDGVLHLYGRQAEVINLSGMKVLPREVEEVIAALPGIAEVKVYPGKTRYGTLQVRAAVVADDGVDVEQIKAHCESQLVYYKRPARVTLLDALPKSANGKVIRDQLP
jgi:acyl-CoA synthetase (AMP-forming)/AMP-acid ligase II